MACLFGCKVIWVSWSKGLQKLKRMSEFETAKMAVVDLLQKNGALDSIKAQLRSSVLLALQSSTLNQGKNQPGKNSLGKSLMNTCSYA